MMIQLNDNVSIASDTIVLVELDQRFYMNGSETHLIVVTRDGGRHIIQHGFGIDVYALKRRIEAAR